MIFKSKIFRRFLTAYLPVTLAPLIIVAFIALWYGRIEIRDQTFKQLQIATDGAEAQVLDYLNYLKIQTSGYSASKVIVDTLKKHYYSRAGNNKNIRDLNRYLTYSLKNFPECVEMFVLDVNGRVIASSDASNTGKDLSETDYFLNGRKTVYVSDIFREEETGRITWLVSCPVMDLRGNKLLAVLASRIDPITLSDITTERKIRALGAKSQALRIGSTGETYIVNRDNLMITESRFLADVILKQAVDTEIVRCTRKVGETKAANYPDYRGVHVDGASMVIWETLGWIVISETDFKESIIPFQRLLILVLVSGGVLIPLIFFTSWLLSRRLTGPIMRLIKADRAVMQGEQANVYIPGHEMPDDELGELMHNRNNMLTSLKEREDAVRNERDKLIRVFETMEDGVYIVNQRYDIEYLNPVLLKEFGPFEGRKCYEYFHDRKEVCPWCPNQRVFAGETVRWEWFYPKNKKTYDLLDTPRKNPDGSISKLEISRDITERKRMEEILKQRLDDLEQFRKVTIQREIRMRELKDREEELEKEIEKLRGM